MANGLSLRVLDEWREMDCNCRLSVSSSGLEGYLSAVPEAPRSFTPEQLVDLFRAHGLVYGEDADAIAATCERLGRGLPVHDLVIAYGRPPVDAVPAWVEFKVRVSTQTPTYEESENGTVDYHKAHLFENVVAGDVIGDLLPPQEGVSGCSVCGEAVPFSQSEQVSPRAGQGVELRDGRFWAMSEGRVIFEDNVISVSDELLIDGDVDYGIGDIDFVGFVHIKHSVLEGYTVRAKKGIVVDHVVENTRIESDGDIRIGGMAGDGKHAVVRCSGNLTARYLHEVQVESAGDVLVGGEIMNCQLLSGGMVQASLIAGGSTLAASGIEVKRLGSDAGERTYVRSGVGFQHVAALDAVELRLKILREQRDALVDKKKDAPSGEHVRFDGQIEVLSEEVKKLNAERRQILSLDGDGQNAKINVRKALFDGVIIHLGHTEEKMQEYRSGTYSIIEHKGSELVYLSLTPLEKNARELEEELLRKEAEE